MLIFCIFKQVIAIPHFSYCSVAPIHASIGLQEVCGTFTQIVYTISGENFNHTSIPVDFIIYVGRHSSWLLTASLGEMHSPASSGFVLPLRSSDAGVRRTSGGVESAGGVGKFFVGSSECYKYSV